MDTFAEVLLVIGSTFAMIAGIGVVRLPDVLSRMHAASKAPTLGLILVAIGAAIEIGTLLAATTLLLAVVLQLLSAPVGAHALSRAARRRMDVEVDAVDDPAGDEPAGDERTSS